MQAVNRRDTPPQGSTTIQNLPITRASPYSELSDVAFLRYSRGHRVVPVNVSSFLNDWFLRNPGGSYILPRSGYDGSDYGGVRILS